MNWSFHTVRFAQEGWWVGVLMRKGILRQPRVTIKSRCLVPDILRFTFLLPV